MKKIRRTNYVTPGSHNYVVPSREEFHKFFPNNLDIFDYCTNYPNRKQVHKVASAINRSVTKVPKCGYSSSTVE